MSSILPAGKTVQAIEALKSGIDDIASRAEKINEAFRTQLAREERRYETSVEEEKSSANSAEIQAQLDLETARQSANTAFERRKAWIATAYQSSKEHGLKEIEDGIGAQKYEMQKKMLQAERDHQNGLAGAATRYQEFRNALAAEEHGLAEIERAAQNAFKGYGAFKKIFLNAYAAPESDLAPDQNKLLAELQELSTKAARNLGMFHGQVGLRLFRYLAVWVFVLALVAALPFFFPRMGVAAGSAKVFGAAAGIALVFVVVFRFIASQKAAKSVRDLSHVLARGRKIHTHCVHQSELNYQHELESVRQTFAHTTAEIDQQLKQSLGKASELRVACRMENDQRAVHANQRNEELYKRRLQKIDRGFHDNGLQLKQTGAARTQSAKSAWDQKRESLAKSHETGLRQLQLEWKQRIDPIYAALKDSASEAATLFPPWDAPNWGEWTPPSTFSRAAKFSSLEVNLKLLTDHPWTEKQFPLASTPQILVPLCLSYPQEGSLLIETDSNWGHEQAVGILNTVLLRLLSTAPPGRLNFTILDPVGLGQSFAGVMHLADYEEQLINSRIWTQSTQIEEKLAELNEHMEKVIQMYLRNEYQTIAEYNEQAGVIAEKYRFLVVADFPANFTDVAAKRLLSIAASGARCGVFTLIHWDRRHALPQDFIPDELRKSSFAISARGTAFSLTGKSLPGVAVLVDEPPGPELATAFIQQVGKLSKDSSRVEVPFEHVAPSDAELWSEDTTSELRVPIGRTGATKLQYLEIGKGTRQHALIAGKTGSGKSTLFHVIITNLALWCSPEQVEFYLVDFKKGVEFKCYAAKRLPHARVVAIESDREFGLSVLQRLDDELRRRGDLFRNLGVQDIAGYKKAGGKEPIPRTLLLVDEFQEFFVEDDKVSQTASLLLDRIVRQGRAFGIHVLLGSQTLGGAYTVARTTLGQMVVRIALQCNEADAYLIMDENNPAPRLLSRPGEGIYNDMAGALEGNSPFQVVWLPDEVRDRALERARTLANRNGDLHPGPIVFEGNAPADVRENAELRRVLNHRPVSVPTIARVWIGAPNSIKGPTEVQFQRQSGNNLLIVGQREEAILAMLSLGLISLSAEYPVGAARFYLLDSTPAGTSQREYLERIIKLLPHEISFIKGADVPGIMKELSAEMKQRSEAPDTEGAPPVFLIINGLQKFSRLRYEEEFGFSSGENEEQIKPGAVLNQLICEGTRLGFHIIATCDTYNNLSRTLSRKAVSEFEMRVLFQMSANDSASLIDNPKAGALGLHRALYFNAQEGYLETFRPYALPGSDWLDEAGRKLAQPAEKAIA